MGDKSASGSDGRVDSPGQFPKGLFRPSRVLRVDAWVPGRQGP